MKAMSVIEDEDVIKKIFKRLRMWEVNLPEVCRVNVRLPLPMPKAKPACTEPRIDYPESQVLLKIMAFLTSA
jgi:hypothetical protein